MTRHKHSSDLWQLQRVTSPPFMRLMASRL